MKYAILFMLCAAAFATGIDDIKGRSTRELGGWCYDWDDVNDSNGGADIDEAMNQTLPVQLTNTTTNTTGLGSCDCNCTCDCFSCNCSCNCTTPLGNQTVPPPGNDTNQTNTTNCTCHRPRRPRCHQRCRPFDCDGDDYWITEELTRNAEFLEYEDLSDTIDFMAERQVDP
ncbi:unnamed protein product [Blepharisma stoltei]|uniref:Uncharacterized protein n=1 Tax=Blepharisma stoltei TaxID=1481888 RepID=A0AAU9IV48_9CILI|nr:unnamed protein product [Blepharisma stoltei]